MTVLHTGSTKKFVAGWEAIFSGSKGGPTTAAKKRPKASKKTKAQRTTATAKPAKKRTAK